jgi:hypothetical protein
MHKACSQKIASCLGRIVAGLGLCGVLAALALGGTCRPAPAQDTQGKDAQAGDMQARPEAGKDTLRDMLKRMQADADPSYEVATVKPSNPDDHNRGIHREGRHLGFENATMNSMLIFAYGIHPKQLADAPAWFASDRYDVDGVLDMKLVAKKAPADVFVVDHVERPSPN